jgi:uncharacterized lipoprotein YehR (DUF1307 family)
MQLVKKVALVFLASGVLMGTLAGCGEKKEPEKKPAEGAPAEPAKGK